MLEHGFMQRALAAAVLVGVLLGCLGFFVILRRLAFVGVGVSHAALGGVALGVVLGVHPLAAAAAFSSAMALLLAWLRRRSALEEDALIGVLLSGSMAFGVVLLSLEEGYRADLFSYLFGNVLAVSPEELVALAAVAAGILMALGAVFPALLFTSLDEEVARAYGHPVDRHNALLLVLLATAVVVGVRLVGILLVQALLVVPAAVAALFASHYRGQILLSVALAVGCGVVGLALAYRLDVPAGGAIALVAVVVFLTGAVARRPA